MQIALQCHGSFIMQKASDEIIMFKDQLAGKENAIGIFVTDFLR